MMEDKNSKNKYKIKTLNNNSQLLRHLAPNVMTREFVISLYADLEDNKEFRDLITSIQKMSSELVSKSQLNKTSCYNNLRETNEEISRKMEMVEKMLTNQVLSEVENTYKTSEHTHAGFANYLFYAWANEYGISLRPDMLYHTIICETISYIFENEEKYKNILKKSSDSILVNKNEDISKKISENVYENLKKKDFKTHVIDVSFDCQPSNFPLALNMCFTTPLREQYNNITQKCGIPSVDIIGSEDDWVKLLESIAKLSTFVPSLGNYYVKCSEIVDKLIKVRFNKKSITETDKDFVANIFFVSGECESNHCILMGWFKTFYLNESENMECYPTHCNYVTYTVLNNPNNLNYIKVCGLNYSVLENDTLIPYYGESVYEVRNDKIFELFEGKSNIIIPDENKVKDMIRSTMITQGLEISDKDVENVYESLINDSIIENNFVETKNISDVETKTNNKSIHNISNILENSNNSTNLELNLSIRLINTFAYIGEHTTTVVKKNWKTTLALTALTIASAIAIKLTSQ